MSFMSVTNVVKTFGSNTVVKGFDLAVEKGEFVSFLGPSGCGKTTVLRMIAGFERPTSGTILIDGRDVTKVAPNKRRIGMVFQAYALFPNLNVSGNIAFGLKIAGLSKADIETRVREMLDLIGLSHLAQRYPYELSGGQQQRVALARALAPRPQVLLLDEPLSALDAKIRVSLREEIRAIQRQLGITTVFVTHDQEEAMSISDRIVVMNAGRADQIGSPFEIYNRPKTRFVAGFVGTLNVLNCQVDRQQDQTVSVAGTRIRLAQPVASADRDGNLTLALRPEALSLKRSEGHDSTFEGLVQSVNFMGSVVRIRMQVGSEAISFDMFNNPNFMPPSVGQVALAHFASSDLFELAA
jgi:putative spermidine/putrescine transport system ATP-binding protein